MKETLKNKPLVIQLGTAVAIIIFLVTWSYRWGGQMERIDFRIDDTNARVDHLSEKYTTVRQDITALQVQNNEVKAQIQVVQAILSRVEATLQEIKHSIK